MKGIYNIPPDERTLLDRVGWLLFPILFWTIFILFVLFMIYTITEVGFG